MALWLTLNLSAAVWWLFFIYLLLAIATKWSVHYLGSSFTYKRSSWMTLLSSSWDCCCLPNSFSCFPFIPLTFTAWKKCSSNMVSLTITSVSATVLADSYLQCFILSLTANTSLVAECFLSWASVTNLLLSSFILAILTVSFLNSSSFSTNS